jgi:GAF domain-containing protein
VVDTALSTVDGAQYAAITTRRGAEKYVTVAATDVLPRQVDEVQYAVNEGPCLTALDEDSVCESVDISSDDRWPRFGPTAYARTGIVSMLSHPLYLEEGDTIGALNLYSTQRAAFDENSRNVMVTLATHAAIAMTSAAHRETNDQLRRAIESNRIIGMAMGILMQTHKITAEQSFDALRIASQHAHRKLVEVAGEVVETGQLVLPPHH